MAIRVSVNPALQRLAMILSMFFIIAFFLSVLIDVGKGKNISLCTSNETLQKTCWNWNLSEYSRTFKCPFTLLFTSLLIFMVSLFLFFMSGLLRCLCPELIILSYRVGCCRIISKYFLFMLHMIGSIFAFAFLVPMVVYSNDKRSCYYTGDMMRNCTNHRSLCWMLCLVCFGFIACLIATMFSAFEARKFYVERLDDGMADQLHEVFAVDS